MLTNVFTAIVVIFAVAGAYEAKAATRAPTSETWTCTYPDFSPQHTPIIVRYISKGGLLDEVMPPILAWLPEHDETYKVIEADEVGIVAVRGVPGEIAPGDAQPSIGAFVVSINRRTGEFTRGVVIAPNKGPATAAGTCLKN